MRRTNTHSPTLTAHEWAELHDALTLALDALGEGPQDVDRAFLSSAMMNQRIALQITHRRAERLGLCFSQGHRPATHWKGEVHA